MKYRVGNPAIASVFAPGEHNPIAVCASPALAQSIVDKLNERDALRAFAISVASDYDASYQRGSIERRIGDAARALTENTL